MFGPVDKSVAKSAGKQIRDMLCAFIDAHPADTQLPTEDQLRDIFGVSPMTVNKAVTELTKEGLLYRIRSKGTYVKKQKEKQKSVKFLLPGPGVMTSDSISARICRQFFNGVISAAKIHEFQVETILSTLDHQLDSQNPEMFRSFGKDDNVFVLSHWWYPIFPALNESGANVVYVNRQEMPVDYNNWYTLTVDATGAASDAVDYLVEQGRAKICYLGASQCSKLPCFSGYKTAIESHELKFDSSWVMSIDPKKQNDADDFEQIIQQWYTTTKFDALILAYRSYAEPVLKALQQGNINVPDDVAILSLADDAILNELNPPVTSMVLSNAALGAEAVKLFDRVKFHSGETVFRPTLLERESTCKGAGKRENRFLKEDKQLDDKQEFLMI